MMAPTRRINCGKFVPRFKVKAKECDIFSPVDNG